MPNAGVLLNWTHEAEKSSRFDFFVVKSRRRRSLGPKIRTHKSLCSFKEQFRHKLKRGGYLQLSQADCVFDGHSQTAELQKVWPKKVLYGRSLDVLRAQMV